MTEAAISLAPRILMRAQSDTRPLSFDASGRAEPLINSAAFGWPGLPFELHNTCPTDEPWHSGPVEGEAHLRVVVDGSFDAVLPGAQRDVRRRVVPGSLTLHVHSGTVLKVAGSAQVLAAQLTRAWLERLLHDAAPRELREYVAPAPDETARSLARAMCAAVGSGEPQSALFAESLSLALPRRVLERMPRAPERVQRGLSDAACRKLRAHIDARLADDLSLVELAALCGLRPRQFGALFARAFGVTPHRYVLQRRLAHGARLLRTGRADLADLAIRSGFCSQSHFTTAFRRAYGTTPASYALIHRKSF